MWCCKKKHAIDTCSHIVIVWILFGKNEDLLDNYSPMLCATKVMGVLFSDPPVEGELHNSASRD
jgi:hypothetical protein